jgi:hypothetical protein
VKRLEHCWKVVLLLGGAGTGGASGVGASATGKREGEGEGEGGERGEEERVEGAGGEEEKRGGGEEMKGRVRRKGVRERQKMISQVDPGLYGTRFVDFIKAFMRGGEGGERFK